jgi:hypothetical protein
MKRFAIWLGRNVDPLLALLVAGVIVTLDIVTNVPSDTVNAGILLVLGVLSVAVLRDRVRDDEVEERVQEQFRRAGEVQVALEALEKQVGTASDALSDASMVRVLAWPEITQALAAARRDTDRWQFRGGTGTYIRAVTLPECVANARRDRRALLVRLEIIDPTNDEVCTSYARFRRSVAGAQTGWTVERTRRESYATIVAASWHAQRYELLDIEIGLSQTMPTLRWDLSKNSLLITQEDPRNPALMVDNGKLLYDYFHTELRKSFEQARRVSLDHVRHLQLSDDPTVDEVRKLFQALNMPLPSTFTDREVVDIVKRALHAENPYDQ